MEFKFAPFKRTPLSASIMEELGFVPCEPIKRGLEARIPDRTWCADDGSDILIEWYEDEPYDEYDTRRSKWMLLSRRCRFSDIKSKETLQTLLSIMEE